MTDAKSLPKGSGLKKPTRQRQSWSHYIPAADSYGDFELLYRCNHITNEDNDSFIQDSRPTRGPSLRGVWRRVTYYATARIRQVRVILRGAYIRMKLERRSSTGTPQTEDIELEWYEEEQEEHLADLDSSLNGSYEPPSTEEFV
ncbi:hypothetical protein O1611_g2896 [Lasiodiplodia mahajangana]|uniref:Uncharacterized protein n=1 Tax=Lasiodiplodia mahajangana TaxID=1108764 RepID=A0ACC2JT91_9PEZI|nr:hypothetical protein O1611_g2896 [Lasiodiplodia mahajangana]